MRNFLIILLAALPWQPVLGAQDGNVVSSAPNDISVTIYRDDLALITEKRTIDLPRGRSKISFEGVSDRMIPQTALLREFEAVTIERNFDFDLISPAAFFEKSIGEKVLLSRTNVGSGKIVQQEATIVAAGDGVIFDVDGAFEAYQCSGIPESVDFYSQPENLKALPTLSLVVDAETAGPQDFTISYLASGFEWAADYVLTLKNETEASLIGWLTVTNSTATSINDAPTSIVAGNLQILPGTESEEITAPYFAARCWPSGTTRTWYQQRQRRYAPGSTTPRAVDSEAYYKFGAALAESDAIVVAADQIAEREDLGDYKLYRTPEPTSVSANQTKQVLFLNSETVDIEKFFVFDLTPNRYPENGPTPATIEYRIDNSVDSKLAQALPEGIFRVMTKTPSGKPFFLGEDDQKDLAIGLPVKIAAAHAADIQMETWLTRNEGRGWSSRKPNAQQLEHRITNASRSPAQIEITIGKDFYTAVKVTQSSKRVVKDESIPTWRFVVPPESEASLSYRVEWTN